MPRSRVTLADLKRRLRERVGDTSTFWNDVEATDALNEAISVWQALAGEWTTQISIPAVSDSPSFYPVAKQIVSLTRVGLADSTEPPSLGLSISSDAFPLHLRAADENPGYSTSTGSPVQWMASPVGGVAPYSFLWEFPDGSTSQQRAPIWAFDDTFGDGAFYDVTCTVTDASGDTFTQTYSILLLNHEVILSSGGSIVYGGIGPLLTGLTAYIYYWGSDHTEYWEPPSELNQYPRYPITVTFNFAGEGTFADGTKGSVVSVELAENGGPGLVAYPDGKISYTIHNGWEFTSEGIPPGAGGGKYLGQLMWQDVDGGRWGSNPPDIWPIFDTMTQNRIDAGETFTGSFTVSVTDGTTHSPGYVATSTCTYEYALTPPESLCWYWSSNPTEGTPSVEIVTRLEEETPGQWDSGGTYTVIRGGVTVATVNVSSWDLGWVNLGEFFRDYTPPTNPPPTETFQVTLAGGTPYKEWESSGDVQFQQDAGGDPLSGTVGCPFINITGTVVCLGGGGGSPDGAEVRVFYEYPVGQPSYAWQEDWCAIGNWVVETSPGVFEYDLTSIAYGCAANIPSGEPFILHVRCASAGPAGTNQVAVPGGWPAGPFNLDIDIPLCPLT